MPKAISEDLEKRLQEMGDDDRILVDIVPAAEDGFSLIRDFLWDMKPRKFSYYKKKNQIDAYLTKKQIYELGDNGYVQAILEKPLKV